MISHEVVARVNSAGWSSQHKTMLIGYLVAKAADLDFGWSPATVVGLEARAGVIGIDVATVPIKAGEAEDGTPRYRPRTLREALEAMDAKRMVSMAIGIGAIAVDNPSLVDLLLLRAKQLHADGLTITIPEPKGQT